MFFILVRLCKRLISLNYCQLFPKRYTSICLHKHPQTKCTSESLTILKVNVKDFDDCLYLLDSNLNCLSKLIINIEYIEHKGTHTFDTVSRILIFVICENNNNMNEKRDFVFLCRKNFLN